MQFDKTAFVSACKQREAEWSTDAAKGVERAFHPFRSVDLVEYARTFRGCGEDEDFGSYAELLGYVGDGDFDAVFGGARILSTMLEHAAPHTAAGEVTVEPGNTARLVLGDLSVDGDVSNGGILVVLGDLRVGGNYWDRDVGCQLVVLGSAWLARADVYGGTRIGGDLTVSQALWGIDHSDGIFVGGTVRAKLAMLDDKRVRAGAADIELLVADEDELETPSPDTRRVQRRTQDPEDLRGVIRAELVFDPDEQGEGHHCPINVQLLFEKLKAGEPIWQGT